MKPYFGKQVIERPRAGSAERSLKMRQVGRIDEDGEYDGPARVSMAMGAGHRYNKKVREKSFTDVLGPVYRYFHGKVGHRWDDVYSELMKAFGNGSHPMQHILYSHILSRGYRDVDGPLDLYAHGGWFHVKDGLVAFAKHPRWKAAEEPVRKVLISNGRYFVEVEGLWYIGMFIEDNLAEPEWPNYREGWGSSGKVYRFVKEKQANRKELKSLKKLIGC